MSLTPDRWQDLSVHLERALELSESERASFLEALRARDPVLADDLQALLDTHASVQAERFLETEPPGLPRTGMLAGQAVGAYVLVSLLGEGGMGAVWLAERSDGRFSRKAAIKFLRGGVSGVGGPARFTHEGRVLGRLTHPNIAQLLDAGVLTDGQPYLVLEYVDGEPIDTYCDRLALGVEARVRLFLDVLAAVAHAHANLIVHRDIKPSNVLVTADRQVKLLDFGIAKLLEQGSAGGGPMLTRDGASALTPQYASPEQITGQPITTATDVYALGVLLYELLTGHHPAGVPLRTPADVVKAIVDIEPGRASVVVARTDAATQSALAVKRSTTPDALRRMLRGDLDTILAKALKKDPAERYTSVTALAADLRGCLRHEPISATPDTVVYRAVKFVRRNRVAVVLAALGVLAAAAGVIGTLTQARTARAQRDFAVLQLSRAEAINELNTFLLSDAAPLGKPFTVNDLLARAERMTARQQRRDATHIQILISIGRQYWNQDQDADAVRVLTTAYEQSRDVADPSTRARAACALGAALARGRDVARAETLVREGLGKLPDEPPFALDRIFCLMRGAEVARDAGKPVDGVVQMQAAQRILAGSPFDSELLELRVVSALAEAYRATGRYQEAIATFERTDRLVVSLGRDDTQSAGTLFNNWGLTLNLFGRPLDAARVFRRAIDISRADASEDAVSPMLLVNYARVLRELGRLDEAVDYAERASASAERADDQIVILQALLERGRIYRDQRDTARSAAMLDAAEPRLRASLPEGHVAFATILADRAQLMALGGNPRGAERLLRQAVDMAERATAEGRVGADFLQQLLLRRSTLALDLGRHEQAVADARRAVAVLQPTAPPGALLSTLGRAHLGLARALLAQGRQSDARAEANRAAAHLESAVGREHADARAAREIAGS